MGAPVEESAVPLDVAAEDISGFIDDVRDELGELNLKVSHMIQYRDTIVNDSNRSSITQSLRLRKFRRMTTSQHSWKNRVSLLRATPGA
jgi:hypothetical protein